MAAGYAGLPTTFALARLLFMRMFTRARKQKNRWCGSSFVARCCRDTTWGLRDPFLFQLVPAVVEQLGTPYPELRESVGRVVAVVEEEEKSFYSVIDRGIPRVEKIVQEAMANGQTKLDAQRVADVYQTHGVPPTIAESVAEHHGFKF